MPTKAMLESLVQDLQRDIESLRHSNRRLHAVRFLTLDTGCEVEECDYEAEYLLDTATDQTRLCDMHAEAAKCLLRQAGWEE